jgi:hypothetical protein
MTFSLVAPIPLLETTTILPNPTFGDSEASTDELNVLRAVDGTRRTYVKSKGRRRLRWDFLLTRNKAIELLEFYRAYHAHQIFIEDHNERRWIGYFINNPLEVEMIGRGLPSLQDWPVGERCQASIEFEGTQTNRDVTVATTFSEVAPSSPALQQSVSIETPVPLANNSLRHNWDAFSIVQADNTLLNNWSDSTGLNNLVATVGGTFDPTINRAPTYIQSSSTFNLKPAVSFDFVSSDLTTQVAAMQTTSVTSLFPNRRGTIFWVFAHTVEPFNVENEFGVWALSETGNNANVEQFHMSGSSSPIMPTSVRFQPADASNDVRPIRFNTSVVPSGNPFIYMNEKV